MCLVLLFGMIDMSESVFYKVVDEVNVYVCWLIIVQKIIKHHTKF